MPFIKTPIKLAGGCLLLAACNTQTTIQTTYVANRNQCQQMAEANIGRFIKPGEELDIRSRNAKLVTLFSDCMFEQGWTVATPERADEQEVAQKDDLPELNDVPATAAAAATTQPQPARAPSPAADAPIAPHGSSTFQPTEALDDGRRSPSQQLQ